MSDPITHFPDADNLAAGRDFLDIQSKILEAEIKRKTIYEQIGRISLDVQQKIITGGIREQKLLENLRTEKVAYYQLIDNAMRGLRDKESTGYQEDLKSIKEKIAGIKTQLALSKEVGRIEVDMAEKNYKESTKWANFAVDKFKELTGFQSKEIELTQKTGVELRKLGVNSEYIAYSIGATLMMLKGALDLFKVMDTAAWKFRETMGMTRVEAKSIRRDAEDTAIAYKAMGITIDGVYKSYRAIGQFVGGVHNVTKDMAADVALMASQLGVSEDVSAGFMRNLAAVSRSSMESQTNMMGLAQSMASSAGVPLADVMKDVGTHSDKTLTMMSRMPNTVLKTAIELRRMGTSLDQAANSSRHILDFTENMNEEMDASVLLGRSINLQHARELAYKRDLEGSTQEILRITKSINFEKLDVYQQEAYAKATGKTVDELLNMLQTDKQISAIKSGTNAQAKAELAVYEKMRKENEKTAKARGKDAMAMVRTMANQERMVQLSNKWNSILQKAQQLLLPIIDLLLSGALYLMDWLPLIMGLTPAIKLVFVWFEKWITGGSKIVDMFSLIGFKLFNMGGRFEKIGSFIVGIGGRIGQFFGLIGKAAGFAGTLFKIFGKFLGPIGWVIMAFQAISGAIKGCNSTTGNWIQKLGGGIMGALRGIIPGFDYIVGAIKWLAIWTWKIGKFFFLWTSPIGWSILAFQKFKKMFPETYAALGNLFSKMWGLFKSFSLGVWNVWKFLVKWTTPIGWVIMGFKALFGHSSKFKESVGRAWEFLKKVASIGYEIARVIFRWLPPVMVLRGAIKMLWPIIKSVFSNAWASVKGFFNIVGAVFNYVKSQFTGMEGGLDHFIATLIKGITHIGGLIVKVIEHPFSSIFGMIGSVFGSKEGGSVEHEATAAYIPVAQITPKQTTLEPTTTEPATAGSKETKPEVTPMSEETGQKMVALLEKINAKDTNINMDGQLLSTTLARQTEFKGGYGVNKVA